MAARALDWAVPATTVSLIGVRATLRKTAGCDRVRGPGSEGGDGWRGLLEDGVRLPSKATSAKGACTSMLAPTPTQSMSPVRGRSALADNGWRMATADSEPGVGGQAPDRAWSGWCLPLMNSVTASVRSPNLSSEAGGSPGTSRAWLAPTSTSDRQPKAALVSSCLWGL